MNKADVMKEAARCINCKHKPCMVACPAHNDIPLMLKYASMGEFDEARRVWHQASNLPELCGNLCQNDHLCVGHCTLQKLNKPIQIGFVEAYLGADQPHYVGEIQPSNGKRHLVIGLGPSGLANAIAMAERGYQVVAMDRQNEIGGTVYNLIPDFRFDKDILTSIKTRLERLHVDIQLHTEVGVSCNLTDLAKQYDSIYIAHGLDSPQIVPVETENVHPYYAIDLLDRHKYQAEDLDALLGHHCVIIGLGNVAIDMARTLLRLNKQVTILYRRTIQEAPAGYHEIMDAIEEGLVIQELLGPVKFYRQGEEKYLDCEQNCLIKDPHSARSMIEKVPDSSVRFQLDELIFATGQASSDVLFRDTDIRLLPEISPYHTNHPNIFVGGDRVNKQKRIVDAMVSELEVAKWIHGE